MAKHSTYTPATPGAGDKGGKNIPVAQQLPGTLGLDSHPGVNWLLLRLVGLCGRNGVTSTPHGWLLLVGKRLALGGCHGERRDLGGGAVSPRPPGPEAAESQLEGLTVASALIAPEHPVLPKSPRGEGAAFSSPPQSQSWTVAVPSTK